MWIDTMGIEYSQCLRGALDDGDATRVIKTESPEFLKEMKDRTKRNHSLWIDRRRDALTEVKTYKEDLQYKTMWKQLSYVEKHLVYVLATKKVALQKASNIFSKAKILEEERYNKAFGTLKFFYENRESTLDIFDAATRALRRDEQERKDIEYSFMQKLLEVANLCNMREMNDKADELSKKSKTYRDAEQDMEEEDEMIPSRRTSYGSYCRFEHKTEDKSKSGT